MEKLQWQVVKRIMLGGSKIAKRKGSNEKCPAKARHFLYRN